ncbi:uncharacterized protein LOC111869074 isoform X2 [Cryptotermes secundus]|uniref:uncharacterized protein LOC111869074 isoform X2 n=1 Tax=Cryptotermes secundus TaxID=105785 RepID=UPI001454C510|nr:uncharacterized protein LOC111869074 isoform X2 [Cryptotermes secundus]
MEEYTPVHQVHIMGETPLHTDDSGYLTTTPSSAESLNSVPSSNRKLSHGCKYRCRNCAALTPGTLLSHTPSVCCHGALLSAHKKKKASLGRLKLLHRNVSLLSSTEGVKDSPSGYSELQSQSKSELLISNDFDDLSLVENSFDSEENGILDDSATLYEKMEVDGNESEWKADSHRDNMDNTDNMGQISVRKSETEYHATHMLVPHEGCRQDSETGSQEMVNLYHSQERDSSVEDHDLIINKHDNLTRRDLSRDLPTKCQKFEEATERHIQFPLKYSSQQLLCQIGREKVDFLYLLSEKSDHHIVVKDILSYLEPVDLTAVAVVSKTWNRVCKSDSASRRRIRKYLKKKRQNKENNILREHKSNLPAVLHSPKNVFKAIDNLAYEGSSQVVRSPSSPPTSPSKRRFLQFYKHRNLKVARC